MKESADRLLEELGALGSINGTPSAAGKAAARQTGANLPSVEKQDEWRILLVDLVYLLNASFRDAHYWEGVKTQKDTFKDLVNILHDLNQMPNHDGVVRILHRGSQGAKVAAEADYVIRFGDLNVDVTATAAVIKRMGIRLKHIEGRLIKAFEMLAAQGFATIFIKIPHSSDGELERMRVCLGIISRYKKAVLDDVPIEYATSAGKRSILPILNEYQQPDPNLTMLAALNELGPDKMKEIVQKVAALMKRPEFAQSGIRSPNVYKTVIKVKSLRQKLTRPPIEVNSETASQPGAASGGAVGGGSGQIGHGVQAADGEGAGVVQGESGDLGPEGGLAGDGDGSGQGADAVLDSGGGSAGDGGLGTITGEPDPEVLRADIARFVAANYSDSPETGNQVINTIFSDDYSQLEAAGLEERLRLLTGLLASLQNSDSNAEFAQQVINKIQAGVDQIPTDLLDDLVVQNDVIKIWDGEDEKIVGEADENLLNIIESSKERSSTKKKSRAAIRPDAEFPAREIEQLAESYDIPQQEAEEICNIFKACFDSQGNFQRILFEKKVPEFARYPKHIFEILWESLKVMPRRRNRLPLLNSLQLLVNEINQPKQAIKTLISDFIIDPAQVAFADRNAMMLAIQLLRTYNKEFIMDIEITPEEVLRAQDGLDKGVARYAAWKVDGEQKKIVEKVIAIRKKIFESFELDESDESAFSVRFLLAMEREMHIFLALVGGETAAAVIRGALNVYGNPAARVYQLGADRQYTSNLLQHLAVLIRSLARVGQPEDIAALDEIIDRKKSFDDLSEEPRHAAQVKRTLSWIEEAINEIRSRNVEGQVSQDA